VGSPCDFCPEEGWYYVVVLRLAGYYQRFIEVFSKISKPTTKLLEKDKQFEWMPTCEASFQELRK
jgi:hypothetical protein